VSIQEQIREVNRQLKLVSIREKKGWLYLRATLPPRPGEVGQPKQHELRTGCNATAQGLKIAKAKALEVESQVMLGKFEWTPWLRGKYKPAVTVEEWVAKFEEDHWASREQSPTKLNSWKKDYQQKLEKLPQDRVLTGDLLRETVLHLTKPATRSRVGFCMAYRKLARFAGIDADLEGLDRGYSPEVINLKELPSDQEIQAIRNGITNPAWRWVFDVMAIYGLRNHEVFRLNLERLDEDPAVLIVLRDSKTKGRVVWPCAAEFWEDFDPVAIQLPGVEVNGKCNNDLGERVTMQFRQMGVKINPYALRHCWLTC
jgi:integrase